MMWAKILIRRSTDGVYSDIHDWLCIHDTSTAGTAVIDPVLKDEKNAISTLSFAVYAGSEAATLLNPANRDKCEVWVCEYINYDTDPWSEGYTLRRYYEDSENVWRLTMFVGHAVEFTPQYTKEGLLVYKILCEDNRGYLNKSVQTRREYHLNNDGTGGVGGAVGYYKDFVAKHNDLISGATFERDQFFANYGVTNQFNDYAYIVDWEKTYSALQERFIERFGGELVIDNNWYVDETPSVHYPNRTTITWVQDYGRNSDCVIQNGVNLKSLTITTNAQEVCTRLIPLGAMTEDGSRVNIYHVTASATSVVAEKTDGYYYIDIADSQYIADHGITCKTIEFDDITDPMNLYTKAVEWLTNNNRIKKTYEAEVLDLAANGGLDHLLRLRCGDYHRLVQSDMGVDETLQIVKIEYNLTNLFRVNVTFGDKFYNDIQQGLAKDAAQTAKVDKVIYNSNSAATTLASDISALTSKQEYDVDSFGYGTISGKEITLTITQGSGAQELVMGKFGLVATEEGIAGYSGTSTNPSFILTYFGELITDGSITLRSANSDLLINVNGSYVSLRTYLANHP